MTVYISHIPTNFSDFFLRRALLKKKKFSFNMIRVRFVLQVCFFSMECVYGKYLYTISF
jgi:hypothetical protein